MARAGLGDAWNCLFANDCDPAKEAAYKENWGDDHFSNADIQSLNASDLPGHAQLAWASFPCQDLSLAGSGAGLKGGRSGTFWAFWRLIQELTTQDRKPGLIVLENVYGALRSHGGKDFAAIAKALVKGGYRFGPMIMDACHFLPQSRPRLFIVAISEEHHLPPPTFASKPIELWHPKAVCDAWSALPPRVRSKWIWWNPGQPPPRTTRFIDIIEPNPSDVSWHTPQQTQRLLDLMAPTNLKKVQKARETGDMQVGGLYRRTRSGVQRAEVRFDMAGCLRTPAGGSSRQTILIIEGVQTRSRLLSGREGARLMGLPESYILPKTYGDAYHLVGDGLAVPVVNWLATTILQPLAQEIRTSIALQDLRN